MYTWRQVNGRIVIETAGLYVCTVTDENSNTWGGREDTALAVKIVNALNLAAAVEKVVNR